jgi:UDP-N-acetylglucosamine kinase
LIFFTKDGQGNSIKEKAVSYIKEHKKDILEKFANDEICEPQDEPISIFMAGSPGAGKTEFSKNLLKNAGFKAVRIDADEIKEEIPQYNGKNSSEVQGASALGVQYLFDFVLNKNKNVVLDGTFADFNVSCENIERSVKRKRPTEIYYVYQDPLVAWHFTKAREALEGRFVPKTLFVNSLFQAKDNVNKIKSIFGNEVKVHLVIKDFEHKLQKLYLNIDNIDNYLKISYNKKTLYDKL